MGVDAAWAARGTAMVTITNDPGVSSAPSAQRTRRLVKWALAAPRITPRRERSVMSMIWQP
jgi:hypothetical protein